MSGGEKKEVYQIFKEVPIEETETPCAALLVRSETSCSSLDDKQPIGVTVSSNSC